MFKSKPQNSLRKRLAGVMLALSSLCTSAFASFGVLEEGDIDYYGNAMTAPFHDAVEGTESLSARDRAYLSSLDQARLINRWYLRLLIGNARVKLKDNQGTFVDPITGVDTFVEFPNFETRLLQGTLAWGKLWENWALEAEIFASRRFQRNFNAIAPGIASGATFEARQYALFFNAQYIIPHVFSYYPSRLQIHLDAGFGPAYKSTDLKTTLFTGRSLSTSRSVVSLAGNLGVGLRYQITPHILVDVAYRYFHMGSTNFGNTADLSFESGLFKNTGLYFGGTYQF